MCLRTMKLWLKWSLKEGGVPQWDMFPKLTELFLIGCSIELIWTPKYKSNTSTPKTNSLTFWPKTISHVMSGMICCAFFFFNISHFSHTVCSTMAKWSQQGSGEERHSKSKTYDESYCKDAVARVTLDFSKPGEEKLWKSKSLEFNC